MDSKFIIKKYNVIKDTIESSFEIEIQSNQSIKNYTLNFPSNPFLDIEILQLHNMDINFTLKKLKKTIKKKSYSHNTINSINNLYLFISETSNELDINS